MNELHIVVKRSDLIARIEKHKKRFIKSYETVLKAYQKKAKKYQEKYAKLVANPDSKDHQQPITPIRPEDRRKVYDFYLKMLERQVECERFIQLSESKYRQLWLDKWDWMHSHIATLGSYANDDTDVSEVLMAYQE